ncbi:MAG: hypothetical protein LBG52_03380 [Candidatus Peribacteria bacterium]|jgi:predicted RNA binding protein YcfA (HicA-like mRNA interferase family)|nr:hypothetical protein [Candidatus Peribacteria bacterium]
MTKQEKTKEQFLKSPKTVTYSKIQSFLVSEGYEMIDGKGSHSRIKHPKN